MAASMSFPDRGRAMKLREDGPSYDLATDVVDFLEVLEKDTAFISLLSYAFFVNADYEHRLAIIKSTISCVFSRPVGVGKNPILQGPDKPSNRIWANFCKYVRSGLETNNKRFYETLRNNSPLFAEYDMLWPECSELITESILALKDSIKSQKEVADILKGIVS
ncbi:hypothetical protein HI914_04131 [Erysiphe necator]|nr:hypothetical protein HI914_04131 [Erysiphe necator]